jgi:glycosyltransferase involved in cell wall biosynthesis
LSEARNAGARTSSAAYVAYLDDDAKAEPKWLEAILRAFDTVPYLAAVGGRVWLDWGTEKPAWLQRRYWPLYSYVDHGERGRLLLDEYLVGANLAFRRDLLLDLGGFNTGLGRRGTSLMSGEEADMLRRLRERNLPIYYAADAIVRHAVPAYRRRKSWLWKRVFWDGASQPMLNYGAEQARRRYALEASRDLKLLTEGLASGLTALLWRRDEIFIDNALACAQRTGRLYANVALAWRPAR